MPDSIMHYIQLAIPYLLPVVYAVVILIVGRLVARFLTEMVKKLMGNAKVDETLVHFVGNLVYIGLMTFVVLAALKRIGIETTSFIAILGAAGLAVGFALQGSLSNFAAGVLMIIFKPFKVGDFVEAGGSAGIVEEIQIFTTRLRTPDNKTIIVPNSKITGDNITNYSLKDTRRIDLVIGVGYDDDLQKVKAVLADVLQNDARVLAEPAPTIGLLEMADSSINFAVRPWVKTADYWDVFFSLNETIKERFDKEGVSIPFPQRDIHLVDGNASAPSVA